MTEEKKTTEKELNESTIKAKDDIIQDTSPGPMVLDINSQDESKNADGILTLRTQFPPRTNNTYSFRISEELVEHFKNEARKVSLDRKEDINWQKLVISVALEKYPFNKEK